MLVTGASGYVGGRLVPALAQNRYDQPDWIVLRRGADGKLPYTYSDDAFPNTLKNRTITFHAAQFDTASFTPETSSKTWLVLPR